MAARKAAAVSKPSYVQKFIDHWGGEAVGKKGPPAMGIIYEPPNESNSLSENFLKDAFKKFMEGRQFRFDMLQGWKHVLTETQCPDLLNKLENPPDNEAGLTIDSILNNDLEDPECFKDAFTRNIKEVKMYKVGDNEQLFGVTLGALHDDTSVVVIFYTVD